MDLPSPKKEIWIQVSGPDGETREAIEPDDWEYEDELLTVTFPTGEVVEIPLLEEVAEEIGIT